MQASLFGAMGLSVGKPHAPHLAELVDLAFICFLHLKFMKEPSSFSGTVFESLKMYF